MYMYIHKITLTIIFLEVRVCVCRFLTKLLHCMSKILQRQKNQTQTTSLLTHSPTEANTISFTKVHTQVALTVILSHTEFHIVIVSIRKSNFPRKLIKFVYQYTE